jgi:hypothetical protein
MQHNNLPDLFREDLESLIIFMMLGGAGSGAAGGGCGKIGLFTFLMAYPWMKLWRRKLP